MGNGCTLCGEVWVSGAVPPPKKKKTRRYGGFLHLAATIRSMHVFKFEIADHNEIAFLYAHLFQLFVNAGV